MTHLSIESLHTHGHLISLETTVPLENCNTVPALNDPAIPVKRLIIKSIAGDGVRSQIDPMLLSVTKSSGRVQFFTEMMKRRISRKIITNCVGETKKPPRDFYKTPTRTKGKTTKLAEAG